DAGTQTLDGFLDGVPSTTTSTGSRQAPYNSGFGLYYAFGAADTTNLGSGAYFPGLLQTIRIFNRALNNAEVQALDGGLANPGTVKVTKTMVGGNAGAARPDVSGGVTSLGNNLIGATDGSSGWVGADLTGTSATPLDALLAPLGNYGGTTQTMALLPGSPAIDAGTSGADIPPSDQRGEGRGGAVDIGAVESQGFTLTAVAGSTPQTSNLGTAFANPLTVTVSANNALEPVDGGVVRFVANPAATGATAILSAPSAVITGGQAAISAAPN